MQVVKLSLLQLVFLLHRFGVLQKIVIIVKVVRTAIGVLIVKSVNFVKGAHIANDVILYKDIPPF